MFATALVLLPAAALAQAGLPIWTNRYNGPGNGADGAAAIALDASGNVIVTGFSYTGDYADFATIKYSSAGVALWTNRYNGPGNKDDSPSAMVVDASGNAIVTGYSFGTGTNYEDYLTIKYSSAGVPLWTNRYIGPRSSDLAKAVAVDTNGNVCVTGTSWNAAGATEYATLKYSSAGVPLWTNRYNRSPNVEGRPCGIAVDTSGNVYLAGSASGGNLFILVYSSAGLPLWTNSSSPTYFRFSAMALDAVGGLYLTGGTTNANGYYDYITFKYSNSGVPLWTNYYDGPANKYDLALALAIDSSGDLVVTGLSPGNGTSSDFTTIKYSSAGLPLWTNRYDGPDHRSDAANAVAVDASSNVYVTGYSTTTNGFWYMDYVTIAYSSSGVPLWTNVYNGPGNVEDEALALAVDAHGNVHITGYSTGSGSASDYATIKYAGIPLAAPAILSPPLSRTNTTGTTASFSVTAAGDAPLKYQWRKGGANLLNDSRVSGVTTTNLVIATVQPSDAGDYTVVVTNFAGSVTSIVAHLTVYSPGRFSSVAYSPALGFAFVFRDGTVGRTYRIQTSPSLAPESWVEWMSFNYTGPIALTDMSAVETTNKFYRAISP